MPNGWFNGYRQLYTKLILREFVCMSMCVCVFEVRVAAILFSCSLVRLIFVLYMYVE